MCVCVCLCVCVFVCVYLCVCMSVCVCVLSQTCVFQGGFDKKHQLSIVPKLDYSLYIYRALYPECIAPDNMHFLCSGSRLSSIDHI